MKNVKTERRKHPRSGQILPLKISKKGLDVITETRNVSCSGVYCQVSKPLPLMSKVGITLLLPMHLGNKTSTEKIKCSGVVVRSEPAIVEQAEVAYQKIAVFFTEISKKDKNKITQYVLQSFRKDAPHFSPPLSRL